ncbi:amino acid synthesis family protein [Burkholderia gladioli]|uniref:Amino acid synthesis family protein n=1 Tax=Burkholderia gladioli (strain BSR3) TaxID=999541 RepID=F2LCB8_BURGS|nr:amino acid synthesis family protein [Burkholderia gladioli]AEA60170.1 hypothetical protein bgla_1g15110 [Burkholderia gladioli BSR3]MBW5287260.1 amino acid synthesis family protein [Burkholderia gladioli]
MSKQPNFETYHIRKWYTQIEDSLANESGELADGEPLRKIVIAAALHNPYAGSFSHNLDALVEPSPKLGIEFARRIRELAAGQSIESYGKACLVGSAGEYEHGNAFLTSIFAEPIREALGGGKSWVPSSGKRGPLNTVIDVPLAHKDALYVRSHYDTMSCLFADAPNADEVLVIFAFATRGRLHARLGGLKSSEIKGLDGLV